MATGAFLLVVTGASLAGNHQMVSAAPCPAGQEQQYSGSQLMCVPVGTQAPTQTPNPSSKGGDSAASGGNCANIKNCDIMSQYINPFINFLAALVGVAVTISIIIGGIQYGSSTGDPQKVAAAKARIRNALIALLTFSFLYALLNFLVPGGLLK